ncbi:MAG: protein phosphatase 2C domain-containing protein [Succinivibrionaceae bacterium]|nr:protein phosphatase 2C domain-containing protein [Succinivibrionaceae bacterium]
MEAIQSSCTGESHIAAGKPRQDCSLAESTDFITIGVVCDGHGGDRYFRSEVGARAASAAARKCAEEFVRNADESLFRDAPFTQFGTAAAEAEKKKSGRSDVRDAMFRQLFASIIFDWRKNVESHARANPVSDNERKKVPQEHIEAFEKTDGDGNRTGIEKTYGCTLICFVQTKSYWFAFHIGDGKCISFSADKDGHISWEEPVPEDRECFLNTTTSICDANAINEFRYCYGGRSTFPLAVFLGSDGIDDSFGEDSNLANFYVQILKKIVRSSPDEAKSELDSTLPELSVHGSKDDKSVVCCFDEERLKPLENGLVEWQCKNVQRAIDELKKGGTESSDSLEKKKLEFKLIKLRSELGDPSDYLKLAWLYENGTGVSQNDSEALEWYRKAAEKGNADAQIELGKRYFEGRGVSANEAEAVVWYRKAADKGNTEAQLELGDRYFEGRGVEQKYSTAAEWYRKAAEQGIARAQYQLGLMYSQGQGVERNYVEAAEWYRKAAEQGSKEAQRSLAGLFEYGKGVGQSYAEAEKWYLKAAGQGSKEAQYSLGLIYAYGKGGVRSNTEAFRWFHKAAEQGYPPALYRLGSMYEYGTGISQNDEAALEMYREAAEKGNRWAQRHLGYLYSSGIGAEQNLLEAEKWYRKAAEQGDAAAQVGLGEMYYAADCLGQDFAEALKWFKKAASQGNAQAQYRLGEMYRDGNGVKADLNLAFMFFSSSAENGNRKALKSIDAKLLKAIGKKGGSSWLKRLLNK